MLNDAITRTSPHLPVCPMPTEKTMIDNFYNGNPGQLLTTCNDLTKLVPDETRWFFRNLFDYFSHADKQTRFYWNFIFELTFLKLTEVCSFQSDNNTTGNRPKALQPIRIYRDGHSNEFGWFGKLGSGRTVLQGATGQISNLVFKDEIPILQHSSKKSLVGISKETINSFRAQFIGVRQYYRWVT